MRNIDFQCFDGHFLKEALCETMIFNALVTVFLRKLYAKPAF